VRFPAVIPNFKVLLRRVLEDRPYKGSSLHGPVHWRRVAEGGLLLCEQTPACDPLIVFLFALLHDSQRENDGSDREHGPRAAAYLRSLQGRFLHLSPAELSALADACHGHTRGGTHADPTIGACWDADRLDLWRAAITPHPRFFSTPAARTPPMLERFRHQPEPPAWSTLAARCAQLSSPAPAGSVGQ
jgi:uncharacterized protein